jgi:hypothetical protein
MSAPIDDGGPAFPVQGYDNPNHGWQYGDNGMSLRDWFAGQATVEDIKYYMSTSRDGFARTPVEARWQFADAMLAARKENK